MKLLPTQAHLTHSRTCTTRFIPTLQRQWLVWMQPLSNGPAKQRQAPLKALSLRNIRFCLAVEWVLLLLLLLLLAMCQWLKARKLGLLRPASQVRGASMVPP